MKSFFVTTLAFTLLITPKADAGFKDWWPFSNSKKNPPTSSQTQISVMQELQDNLTQTLSQFVEYETNEIAAVSDLKKSENYLSCVNNSSESCSTLITELELRAQNYGVTHQNTWKALENSEVDLMNQYAKLPPQIQANLQGQTLYYFQTAYLDRLKLAYNAIDNVVAASKEEHCAQKSQDCADFHIMTETVKYQNLIDLHNSALENLRTGTGEFMPDPKTRTSI